MEPSAQTLHDFLNTMPAVLYEYLQRQDGSGEIKYMSPTSREILGHPCEYFIEDMARLWELIHPDDRTRLKTEDETTINDSFFTSEARIVWPSGEIRWVQFTSKPASKTNEGAVIWSGCIVDTTPLRRAEEEIKTLEGIVPICSHCKKIRDDKGYWQRVEQYIQARSDAEFSHGICNECSDELYGEQDWYQNLNKK